MIETNYIQYVNENNSLICDILTAVGTFGLFIFSILAYNGWKKEHIGKEQMQKASIIYRELSKLNIILEHSNRHLKDCVEKDKYGIMKFTDWGYTKAVSEFNKICSDRNTFSIIKEEVPLYLGEIVENNLNTIKLSKLPIIICHLESLLNEDALYDDAMEHVSLLETNIKDCLDIIKETKIMTKRYFNKHINYKDTSYEKRQFKENIQKSLKKKNN